MANRALEEIKIFETIFLWAIGLVEVDGHFFKLFTNLVRSIFNKYVNYRLIKLLDGIQSLIRSKYQKDIDFIIIRENNEGEFKKNGKILHPNEPYGLAIDISLFIRAGLTGIAHFSFKLAQKRRKQMTNVTKSNTRINTLYYCYIVI